MNVGELIDLLNKYPRETLIYRTDHEFGVALMDGEIVTQPAWHPFIGHGDHPEGIKIS